MTTTSRAPKVRLPRAVDGRSAVQIARQCAREGGVLVRAAYRVAREDLGTKGRGDIVTATDLAVEARIHQIIEAAFPDHSILSEETRSTTAADGWVWVIDPIDGTTNFFQGIPFFCVNIALCLDGEPLLGLTYDPLQREVFLAVQGRGMRLNGRPVRTTGCRLNDAAVVFDAGGGPVGRLSLDALHELGGEMMHTRLLGSAALALAYAAAGRIDFFVFAGVKGAWDIAAGIIQVREAGGAVTDHLGEPVSIFSEVLLAGSPEAHADFLDTVRDESWYNI